MMGLIKEPLEIDFEVDPKPLSKSEEKALSEFIQADKQRREKLIASEKARKAALLKEGKRLRS